jgi:hypothetical protein
MRITRVGLAVAVAAALMLGLMACDQGSPMLEIPAPAGRVEMNQTPIVQGWCGLAWGTSAAQFKKRYPQYHVPAGSTGRSYGPGGGDQVWLGYHWLAPYNFNNDGQLAGVDLMCRDCNGAKAAQALTKKFGYPTEGTTTWKKGPVTVKLLGTVWGRVRITHQQYSQ